MLVMVKSRVLSIIFKKQKQKISEAIKSNYSTAKNLRNPNIVNVKSNFTKYPKILKNHPKL